MILTEICDFEDLSDVQEELGFYDELRENDNHDRYQDFHYGE